MPRPHKKTHIVLNFDKKALFAKVPNLDYHTARRLKGPIYDVLIQEFNENGCTSSAKYFRCLADKETLFYNKTIIRNRLQDEPELLYQLFDYCMASEKTYDYRDCGGLTASFYLMYQLLALIQAHEHKYQWLLKEAFKIVMKIIRHIEPKMQQPEEIVARLYCMYGQYLSQSQDGNSIIYLQKALELSRGQRWLAKHDDELHETACVEKSVDTETAESGIKTLHEVVVHVLYSTKIKFAKIFGKFGKHSDVASEMAKEAMLLIAEIGMNNNKFEFYNALITYAGYLTDCYRFDEAMKILNKYPKYFDEDNITEYSRLCCKQLMIRGCCNTGLKNIEQAKKDHQQARKIANLKSYRDLEAQALVHLGMLYALKKVEYNRSKVQYEAARNIFLELGDRENESKTHYLLAKLRAMEMFPFFMDILKYTQTKPCGLYKLRRWKNVCEPFWVDFGDFVQKVKKDPYACVLEDNSQVVIDDERKLKSLSRQSIHKSKFAETTSLRSASSRASSTMQIRRGKSSPRTTNII